MRINRREAGRRTLQILAVIVTITMSYLFIRAKMARNYMGIQIERLEREGKGAYVIDSSNFLVFSSYSGPAITIRAIEKESYRFPGRDGYHHIEIDYPWIPYLFEPSHRI